MARILSTSDREAYAADVFCGFAHLAGCDVSRRGHEIRIFRERRNVLVYVLAAEKDGFTHRIRVPRSLGGVTLAALQTSAFALNFVRLPAIEKETSINLMDMAAYAPAIVAASAVGMMGYQGSDGGTYAPLTSIDGLFS